MAESLSTNELYLSRSLRAYEGWVTRYENQIKAINESLEHYKERYNSVLNSVSEYTKSFNHKVGLVTKYARSTAAKVLPFLKQAEKDKEIEEAKLLSSEAEKEEIEDNVKKFKSQLIALISKKEKILEKKENLEEVFEILKKFPEGDPTRDAILERYSKKS